MSWGRRIRTPGPESGAPCRRRRLRLDHSCRHRHGPARRLGRQTGRRGQAAAAAKAMRGGTAEKKAPPPSACMGPGHRRRPPRQIRQPGVRIWPPGHRIWPTGPRTGGLSQRRRRHQERRRGTRGEEDLAAVPCACTDTSRRCSSRGSHLVNLHAGCAGPDRRPAAEAPPTRGGRAPPPPSQPAGRPCRQPAPAAARRARRRGVRGRRRGRGRPSRPAWGSDAGVSPGGLLFAQLES